MFFLLYALALLVLPVARVAGLGLPESILLYMMLALLISYGVYATRARRQAERPETERRRNSFPLHPSH